MAYRYDLARFSPKTHKTPQGFLRAPAFFTRVGVFTYKRTTLRGAPVVEDHPKTGMVSPSNARSLAIGWSSDQVKRADNLVSGEITVIDAQAITKVQNKELSEISLGYNCSIEKTSGHHPQYGRYDQIQRNIRYNHVALGPQDWGRAGSEVSIRLDSEAIAKEEDPGVSWERDFTPTKREDSKKGHQTMEKITIGGVTFEVDPQVAQAIRNNQERTDSVTGDLRSSLEALQGRKDALEEENKRLKVELAEARDPERFDSAVAGRITLEGQARSILGEDAKLPAGAREIQEAVLRHDNKTLDLSGKSDEYVAARFDQLMESEPSRPKPGAPRKGADDAVTDPERRDSEKARQAMIERSANEWQKPLTVSRRSEV
jgi:hypothetical protein